MVTETLPTDSSDHLEIHPDEATQAQQEAIESDIKASSPLISRPLPLSTLDEDFSGHNVYLEKLDVASVYDDLPDIILTASGVQKVLKKRYTSIRRLRRDGNCFYRAFGFAYMEYLLQGKRLKEAVRLKSKCDECRDTLLSLGYTQFTVEDFHEQFTEMVDRFTVSGGSLEELEEIFNNQAYSDYYVVFLRLLVSAYVQKNAAFYSDFIDEGRTISQFCETEVEPMARESDNIHIAALALAVGIPIGIENCQQSGELKRIVFPPELSDAADINNIESTVPQNTPCGEASSHDHDSCASPSDAQSPPVTLLYRPGHYDILYGD